ncbi:MAG: hypothetical protein KIT11_02810 [Fimbriimonadaceae bacterium]|nr:hypothetical protein [Fimbriimonadaceae bacterium]QYK54700.1 MAG: hypothetical protein KF733_06715 [Fimbriimonadaceae bacterium]
MAKEKGKGKGKVFIIAGIAVVVLAAAVVGLALAGILKIPGVTPKKGGPAGLYGEAAGQYAETKDTPLEQEPVAEKPPEPAPKRPPTQDQTDDPKQGAKRIAQLWNNLDGQKLAELAKAYKDPELAGVILQMDPEKASELLSTLDSARAAKLSKEIQKQASQVEPKTGA